MYGDWLILPRGDPRHDHFDDTTRFVAATTAWTALGPAVHLARGGCFEAGALGLIGCGGRGRELLEVFREFPDVEVVAVSDVNEPRMDQAARLVTEGPQPARPTAWSSTSGSSTAATWMPCSSLPRSTGTGCLSFKRAGQEAYLCREAPLAQRGRGTGDGRRRGEARCAGRDGDAATRLRISRRWRSCDPADWARFRWSSAGITTRAAVAWAGRPTGNRRRRFTGIAGWGPRRWCLTTVADEQLVVVRLRRRDDDELGHPPHRHHPLGDAGKHSGYGHFHRWQVRCRRSCRCTRHAGSFVAFSGFCDAIRTEASTTFTPCDAAAEPRHLLPRHHGHDGARSQRL